MLFYHFNDLFFSWLIKSSGWHRFFPFPSVYSSHNWRGRNIWRTGGFLVDSANSWRVDRYRYVGTISFLGWWYEHCIPLKLFGILLGSVRIYYLVQICTVALRWFECFLLRAIKPLSLFVLATSSHFCHLITHLFLIWMYLLFLRSDRFGQVIRLLSHLATIGPLDFLLDHRKFLREITSSLIGHFLLDGLHREIWWYIISGQSACLCKRLVVHLVLPDMRRNITIRSFL